VSYQCLNFFLGEKIEAATLHANSCCLLFGSNWVISCHHVYVALLHISVKFLRIRSHSLQISDFFLQIFISNHTQKNHFRIFIHGRRFETICSGLRDEFFGFIGIFCLFSSGNQEKTLNSLKKTEKTKFFGKKSQSTNMDDLFGTDN
jgi:hypothetical protein